MNRICVFCGSKPGRDPAYAEAAKELALALAESRIGLVYGGASVGIMGVVADAVLAAGGEVTGVIPTALEHKEIVHSGITELHSVSTMHERKALMTELADGFIALPGGFGTLDELFESLTWAQLGIHRKPIGLLNVRGYYDGLISFLETTVEQGFVSHVQWQSLLLTAHTPRALLAAFDSYQPIDAPRWMNLQDT